MDFLGRIKKRITQLCSDIREKSRKIKSVKELPQRAYDWFNHHEDKKSIISAVGMWFAAFIIIIVVCRIGGSPDVAASANEEIVVMEISTSTETSDKEIDVLKEKNTQAETTQEMTTAEPETEPETTAPLAEEPVTVERKVIPIENINVSETVMKDDAATETKKVETIATFNIKTMSSMNLDNSRYAHCIDISYHQGKIDWAAVKAAGIDYAIIRVGYRGYETGKLGKDIRFDENIQGAINNGIQVGVYFFSQAITEQEALEEASVTLEYIKNYNISLPVIIDWETTGGYRTYTAGLSKSKLTSILSTFCDTVKRYGYEPMVYMCKSDYESRINSEQIASKYKTWVAWYFTQYNTNNYASNKFQYGDELPEMSFQYNMWQYSSKGRVNGITECVDMNVLILPEVKYDIKFNVAKPTIVTNVNKPVDLMEGVSVSGSDGKDATSDIVLSLTNTTGKVVTKETAFATPGKYTLSYKYTDKDGTVLVENADLYIRDLPVIYFENQPCRDNLELSVLYEYDEAISAEENYDEIISLLKEKLSACYYDTVEGADEVKQVTEEVFDGIGNIITDGTIADSKITITYKASDGKGLSNARVIKLIINRKQEEESTDSTESSKKEN